MANRKTQVVDEVPQGMADMSQAGPVDVKGLTEQASTAVSVFATLPTWEPHPTLVEIAKMKEEKLKLLAEVGTPAGLKLCKAAKREIVSLCTSVDERRKDVGRDALEYKRGVDKAGNAVMEKLREISDTLEDAIKKEEQKEIEEALAKAKEIEAEQRAKEEQRLALLKADEERKKAEAEAELKRRQDAIDKEREEFELKKAEFERQQQELRDAQEKVRLEHERQQREVREKEDQERREREAKERAEREERERIDREAAAKKQAAEREEQREKDRVANEARIKEAKEKAAADAIEAERIRVKRLKEAADAKAEKDRRAAEKKAKQAPDLEKIRAWWKYVDSMVENSPMCKDPEAIQLVGRLKKELITLSIAIKTFLEAK